MKSVKWSENITRGSPDTDMCVVILFSVTPVPTSSARATLYCRGLRCVCVSVCGACSQSAVVTLDLL